MKWKLDSSFELSANSKKPFQGDLSGCNLMSYEFSITFIVESQKNLPSTVNGVVFLCSSDSNQCSMSPTGFPFKVDGATINFKDPGFTNPWTLIFY